MGNFACDVMMHLAVLGPIIYVCHFNLTKLPRFLIFASGPMCSEDNVNNIFIIAFILNIIRPRFPFTELIRNAMGVLDRLL